MKHVFVLTCSSTGEGPPTVMVFRSEGDAYEAAEAFMEVDVTDGDEVCQHEDGWTYRCDNDDGCRFDVTKVSVQ